ncbi:MAG: GGDEF domain-containing protein [Desulfitobacteriaceae bacterium]|nr:GGDEF domain-containing protein [Desulfitobacteriaceae bacterium]
MMHTVASICTQDYLAVSPLDGVRKIQTLVSEKGMSCCLVRENDHIQGMLTLKDLLNAHPNRIAADVMTTELPMLPPATPLWQAQEIMDTLQAEVVLVREEKELQGILTRTRLAQELGKHTDLLTGLYKSDFLYYQGCNLLAEGQEISIIFLDINNFGEIDKTYGHTKGDLILTEVGQLLKTVIPDHAYLCRFGGDEFVILLAAYLPESIHLAQHLGQAFASHPFPFGITVSVSTGIVGGRRSQSRPDNPLNMITNLINRASLESTKAKKIDSHISVLDAVEIHDIA